ncbi:hypothetical protein K435DRAFT_959641 [Dendrothele bispora CBS 962.96]|uniref:SAGA-associated factor 11 n=1 Tax=Dendrothele bispora (strain CBS 962.96) TaxID=1314807 RepID=A0A4V4HIQ7_DENBC|nr:hypothetical protein K435DRAFT_959641 [Dendrothele bispora CBS 962.96]
MPSKAEKAEKEEVLSALTTKFFCAMLDEFVMDVALKAHKEVLKSRAICEVCQTKCNGAHAPGPSNESSSPSAETKPATGSNTPNGSSTPYLECVKCSRQIASNRYAPHLNQCMDLPTARRAAVPPRNAKSKQSLESRSRSPASDAGTLSDDKSPAPKGNNRSKSKRADEAEFNLKRKRPISPQVSPVKKQKQKGSPVSRVKSEVDASVFSNANPLPPTTSQSRIPSKLRDSSTAPTIGKSNSPSSRFTSPEDTLASLGSGFHPGNGARPSPPVKRPSPPRPSAVSGYIHEEEGDETGSSTDTDSE